MPLQPPPKLAEDVCRRVTLSARARKLLAPRDSANAFLKRLIEASFWDDAIAFMAHALPTRKAVWWSALCVRHHAGDAPGPAEKKALLAVTRWVVLPNEANRKLADEAARAFKSPSAAGCAVRAAAQAGSTEKAGNNPVAARPEVPAQLVAAAVKLAAGETDRKHLCRQYVFIGLDVANGDNRWE